MKKQFLKIVAVLVFAAVAFSSCSVSYREHRMHDGDHHDDHDHHYEEVHRY